MNLYCVYPRHDEWCCFVFAETRNKAKSMLTHYFTNNDEYIDYGCITIEVNTGGKSEICDINCDRLLAFGIKYSDEI